MCELVAAARAARLTLRIEAGELVVRGPMTAAELGREVIARKADVRAYLTRQPQAWESADAIRRMEEADATVERHGCRGADPAVQAAAGRAAAAYRRQDMAALNRACEEVEALSKALLPAAAPQPSG